ncbi:hypothetical protein [Sulfuricystis multivorans]|nr:hypothetical protein [Sulfuricystis multivorans]
MRLFLILLNIALIIAIVFVIFFWNPQLQEAPLPGTHDARLGGDVMAPGR